MATMHKNRRGKSTELARPLPGDGEQGAEVTLGVCLFCEVEIEPGEPFMTAMALAPGRRRLVNTPFHLFCFVDSIADSTADAIDGQDDGKGDDDLETVTRRFLLTAIASAFNR